LGNALSDRQWQDIIGVMRVQAHRLDLSYMRGQQMSLVLAICSKTRCGRLAFLSAN
jgi:hypothetical protein